MAHKSCLEEGSILPSSVSFHIWSQESQYLPCVLLVLWNELGLFFFLFWFHRIKRFFFLSCLFFFSFFKFWVDIWGWTCFILPFSDGNHKITYWIYNQIRNPRSFFIFGSVQSCYMILQLHSSSSRFKSTALNLSLLNDVLLNSALSELLQALGPKI